MLQALACPAVHMRTRSLSHTHTRTRTHTHTHTHTNPCCMDGSLLDLGQVQIEPMQTFLTRRSS